MSQQEFWNSKFNRPDHFYGTEPNAFIRDQSQRITSEGRVLCLGEGEGRNALYLAKEGHDIVALDASDIGLQKAKELIHAHGHTIATLHIDLQEWQPEKEEYDAIVTSFLHLPYPLRREVLKGCVASLKSGGVFIGEFFSKQQLDYSSGGPKDPGLLYSVEEIAEDLKDESIEIGCLEECTTNLDEGPGHQGEASVVRVIFKKA